MREMIKASHMHDAMRQHMLWLEEAMRHDKDLKDLADGFVYACHRATEWPRQQIKEFLATGTRKLPAYGLAKVEVIMVALDHACRVPPPAEQPPIASPLLAFDELRHVGLWQDMKKTSEDKAKVFQQARVFLSYPLPLALAWMCEKGLTRSEACDVITQAIHCLFAPGSARENEGVEAQ
jgi:hypothetical protein